MGIGNFLFFPRLAFHYGGGTFLIPWMVCLFTWSLPLIVAECYLGKCTQRGVLSTIRAELGGGGTWVGAFLAVTSMGLLFYNSVITGWCLKYLLFSFGDAFQSIDYELSERILNAYKGSFVPMISHLVVISTVAGISVIGIDKGVRRFGWIGVVSLFLLTLAGAGVMVFQPGAERGLSQLFFLNVDGLFRWPIWMDALAYSASSFAAGSGVYLTLAGYSLVRKHTPLEGFIVGFGHQAFSLLAAMAVIGLLYSSMHAPFLGRALSLREDVMQFGLVWLPMLFSTMENGEWVAIWFFGSLFLVSLVSLVVLFELPTRICVDFGLQRHQSVLLVWLVASLLGMPGAIFNSFLDNQAFVWRKGLILCGVAMALVFRKSVPSLPLQTGEREIAGKRGFRIFLDLLYRGLIPLQAVALLIWMVSEGMELYPENWWSPFTLASPATWLLQCGGACAALYGLNRFIDKWVGREKP